MDGKIGRLTDKLVVIAVYWLPIGLILTVVLANQNEYGLKLAARGFHLFNISLACSLLIWFFGIRSIVYVLFVVIFFVTDKLFYFREPYLVSLNILFLIGGLIISSINRLLISNIVTAIVIMSGAVMLLQLLGVGEWTQVLSTHGNLSNGATLTKSPSPTLFVDAADLQANHLQGRPAGLFHSNQFASLVILFALALSMTSKGRRHLLVDLLLCATAVLTLAKVVFLGFGALVVVLFIWGGEIYRKISIRFLTLFLISLIAYKFSFPGVFEQNILSARSAWISIILRVSDFLNIAFGIDYRELILVMEKIGINTRIIELAKSNLDSISVIVDAQGGRPMSAMARVVQNFWQIAVFASCVVGVLTLNSAVRVQISKWLRKGVGIEGLSIFTIVCSFSLAANFLSAQFFWFIVGFGLPSLAGRKSSAVSSVSTTEDDQRLEKAAK